MACPCVHRALSPRQEIDVNRCFLCTVLRAVSGVEGVSSGGRTWPAGWEGGQGPGAES